jgi:hypothetical protein
MVVLMILTALGINNSGKDFCTSLCFVPFFVIMVVLLIIFTGSFAIGGILNADFCNGGEDLTPESSVVEIMQTRGIDPSSITYRAVAYVVHVRFKGLLSGRMTCSVLSPSMNLQDCDFDAPSNEYPFEFIVDFKDK